MCQYAKKSSTYVQHAMGVQKRNGETVGAEADSGTEEGAEQSLFSEVSAQNSSVCPGILKNGNPLHGKDLSHARQVFRRLA